MVASPDERRVSDQSLQTEDNSIKPRRPRYWLGILLLSVWIGLQTAVLIGWQQDMTYMVMYSWFLNTVMIVLSLVAFMLLSGLPWGDRFRGLAWLAVLAGIAVAVFRHDGFDGAMVPQFSFRWNPTPEQRIAGFHADRKDTPTIDDRSIEITSLDWPQFRGPNRDGIVRESPLRADWDRKLPVQLWKQPIGEGWSSFAIVGDYAFTQEQRGEEECVTCYDAATGRQIWIHRDQVRFESSMGGNGPRATPTVSDSKVYSLGATGLLNCLQAVTGELIWSRNILTDAQAENLGWGMAGAPLIHGDQVIVNPGGKQGRSVISYSTETGDLLWASGNHGASYAAVRSEEIGGQSQLLIFDRDGVAGLLPQGGEELWRFPWKNAPGINVAQPVVLNDRVLISSGYGSGTALIDPLSTSEDQTAEAVWLARNRFRAKFSDPILIGDYLYGLDENILSCLDVRTGKRRWKRGRYGYGQLLAKDELLLILAESGDVVLVRASPERHEELQSFPAIEGITWNHPVLCRGRLYVRNGSEAACYDLSE